ncbi:Ig-like domain-containing protein [Pelotalea chapellei]|uniref:Ig-like domain-containing protein n=1 Tax=Pelotalea chapellei TaxID=44671 RepID=A0ABS5U9S2_9BACT|nr:Ig-like domain-containing protein [Pelotalea chapellei]MBT1072404.1 Ig-like domain-containing protein [Pelotalea chapellei]
MNKVERYSRRLTWFLMASLLAMLAAGCGNWKGSNPDTTAPTVTSTEPANNAGNVPLNRKITATFSEAMDSATITTTTFTLTGPGAAAVAGTVSYTGATAVFSPAINLLSNTAYTASITTGAKDLAGNALVNKYDWKFTTGTDLDNTAPTVTSTGVVNGATGLPVNRTSTAVFSEAMDPATINSTTYTVTTGSPATPVAGTVTYTGTTATFTPAANLAANTAYTSTITTGAKDLAGKPMASSYSWSWTTGTTLDTLAPTVIATGAYGATGITTPSLTNPAGFTGMDLPTNRASSARFSEPMDQLTITTATVKVTRSDTPLVSVPGTVTYTGTTVTFTPSANFAANTTYTSTITTGVKDLAGNPMASNYSWSWKTGAAPDVLAPTVISTIPADNANDVVIGTNVAATFSKEMDVASITNQTFILKQGLNPVAGAVTYEGTTATFNPNSDLTAGTVYTATIAGGVNGVKDLAGNALASDKVWSFTTAVGFPAGQAIVPLGTAARFAILSNSAITNIPTSAIVGDVGVSPGVRSTIAGLTAPEVTLGAIYAADDIAPPGVPAMLIAAKNDAEIAFLNANAAVRGTPTPLSGNINGLTLVPGLYESGSSIEISPAGILYLDAGGNANAIFIIRSATSITTSATSEVRLTGNAQAANIYWTAGSAITLGTNSKMKGNLLAGTSISLLTGSRLDGRALIQGAAAGQVSLDKCTIVKP